MRVSKHSAKFFSNPCGRRQQYLDGDGQDHRGLGQAWNWFEAKRVCSLVGAEPPARARSIIVGTRACVGVEFPAAQASVGALLQATRDAVAERVEIRRLIDGGRRNTLGQWSVDHRRLRRGRKRRGDPIFQVGDLRDELRKRGSTAEKAARCKQDDRIEEMHDRVPFRAALVS